VEEEGREGRGSDLGWGSMFSLLRVISVSWGIDRGVLDGVPSEHPGPGSSRCGNVLSGWETKLTSIMAITYEDVTAYGIKAITTLCRW
jgi:hypothetical protein